VIRHFDACVMMTGASAAASFNCRCVRAFAWTATARSASDCRGFSPAREAAKASRRSSINSTSMVSTGVAWGGVRGSERRPPQDIGHRRAFLHSQKRICDDLRRSEKPSHLRCDLDARKPLWSLILLSLEGKERVRVVCIDLAVVYRSTIQKHFPKALIVADRFHVIRLVNHHFLACWREIDSAGAKSRGLD
jgi:hypothetical protein